MHPGVQTLSQYEESIMQGTADTVQFLAGIDVLERLTVADLRLVHFHLFQRVHPWAGQFRTPGQMATVAGYPAADSVRIPRDLELALHQTRLLLASAFGDEQKQLAAIVFFHVRFERIHPYQDGNGRSGRTIMAVQFERLFGQLPRFSDQRGYREAIRASSSGDLGPFLCYLAPSAGISIPSSPWPTCYRLAPRFLDAIEGEPSFAEDLRWSVLR